jgi:hypothetical protein
MDVFPAGAALAVAPVAGDPMADRRDAPELLDVDVEQLPGPGTLVAHDRRLRLKRGQLAEPEPAEDAADRRDGHAQLTPDCALSVSSARELGPRRDSGWSGAVTTAFEDGPGLAAHPLGPATRPVFAHRSQSNEPERGLPRPEYLPMELPASGTPHNPVLVLEQR